MIPAPPRERLSDLLHAAAAQHVVVIGDSMLDVYVTGEVDRVSPEAPVPVLRVTSRGFALGGAANVAQNVRALGAECTLVAAVGHDPAGARIRTMLEEDRIRTSGLVTVDRITTQKTRMVARSQQLLRVDEEEVSEIGGADLDRLIAVAVGSIDNSSALVLEDYNKGVLSSQLISASIAAARARGIPIVVDPKFDQFFNYQGATVFKPNPRELAAAVGAEVDIQQPAALAAAVRRVGASYLLLTLGEQGMILVGADGVETAC